MRKTLVSFEGVDFPYYFGASCQDQIVSHLLSYSADKIFIVTDPIVARLYADDLCERLNPSVCAKILCLSNLRESAKTLDELGRLAQLAIAERVTRRSIIVAFGGGVPGNLGGLLAALLFRGIRLVHVPTTLIAMHDSVISFKQAINFAGSKNILGVYHVPTAAFADVQVLQTLSRREIRSGLIESIKNALAIMPQQIPELTSVLRSAALNERDFLRLLEMSLAAKGAVMANDKTEKHAGMALEYGHTIGHAIELHHAEVAREEPISHGEAVGIGMRIASRVSLELGLLSPQEWAQHEQMLDLGQVPTRLPDGVTTEDILLRLSRDNKRGILDLSQDHIPMILLRGLGDPCRTDDRPLASAPLKVVEAALRSLGSRSEPRPSHPRKTFVEST